MTLADTIREHTYRKFIAPRIAGGDRKIVVRVGDVHSNMRLENRHPAICSALSAQEFLSSNSLRLANRSGPNQGANTEFTFELSISSPADLKPGTTLANSELMSVFGVGLMGGMRRNVSVGHLIVVSDHTKSLYQDRWEKDVLHYTGMGKIGDQILASQNRTLAEAREMGTTVYLFEVFDPGRYVFHGEASVEGELYQEAQFDNAGQLRKVWMFPLRLVKEDYQPQPSQIDLQHLRSARQKALRKHSIQKLRKLAKSSAKPPERRNSLSEQIVRNEAVAEYVKAAADGLCDLCGCNAPFVGRDRRPFLECHHVKHLAKCGPDTIENAVALCPNCHRMMHALDRAADRKKLRAKIHQREKKMAQHEANLS